MKRSFRNGLGQEVKKSDLLTIEEEQLLLSSDGASISHPRGLNSRFVYFCCRNFFIRDQ